MLIPSLILTAFGILIMIIGTLIIRKGKTSFIAGNHEMFVPKNEKKLAAQIGWVVIAFGLEAILFPIAFQISDIVVGWHFAVLAGMNVLVVLFFMLIDQLSQIK
ncbi:hypothetical protein V1498_20395 [Peribacillus sp. SCS-26]|uniref:hypothetical protein n=1 Tax=Paraperibacillus marinus TaxID=3115295 RepID=UPI0039066553